MQVAHILLSLGGDDGNTVPKSGVTPSEVAVLRLIHGEDSVKEIQPYGQINRTSRGERQLLVEKYGRMIEGVRRAPAVDELFPGVAARLYETFDELELPEEFFKAAKRVSASGISAQQRRENEVSFESPVAAEVVMPLDPLDHDGDGKKGGSKRGAKKKAVAEVEQPASEADGLVEDDEVPADGIGDMPDAGLFK